MKERDIFWEELKGCIELCEDKGTVLLTGDLETRSRDSKIEGVVVNLECLG